MTGGVPKSRARRSHFKLSKALQGKPLDTVARKSADLPPSRKDRSLLSGDLPQGTTPLQSSKRQLDAASTSDLLPAKRPRLTRTEAQTRTGPSRYSARLQTQQHSAGGEGPTRITQSAPPHEPQTEAGAGSVPPPSKRAGLPRTNTQQSGVENEEVEEVAKTVRQPKPPKRPSTSVLELKVEGQEQVSPVTLLRKRQIDSDGDDSELQLKRARLSRKNLALFDKMAKKKGSNKASVSAPPESTLESSTTKTTSTTTSGFAIQARKNGMLHPLHSKPPTNLEAMHKRHARSRETASPPESRFKHYVNNVGKAVNEATMVVEVSRHMLKEYDDDEGYNRAFNQAFTGFPKDAGFNNGLSAPQPDFVEGLEMEEFYPFPVDEHVSGAALYQDNPGSLTLPHLAGEWKGPGKNMEIASLQARYDGAALVYARNEALSYLGKPDPPGHAEVTTFTTDGTNLNFFAHYAAPSEEDGTLEYHQYQYASANVKDTYQGHKDGRKGIRNEQDHARDQSYALRDQLKEHWKQRRCGLQPIAEGAPLPVADGTFEETNGDEDEAGYEVVELPCQPTPAASSNPRRASGSVSSSKSLPPANDYVPGSGGQKRRASSSQGSSHKSSRQRSKEKSYWELDARSGRYFHEHSDGRVTWAEDDDRY